MSLPSRERGLKYIYKNRSNQRKKSLPSRERGLKYASEHGFHGLVHVAPLAGAWIEITIFCLRSGSRNVAPLAGAWIEMKKNNQ